MMADRGQPVGLPGGATVAAIPGMASSQDSLGGESIVAGRTRTLRFVTADVPAMVEGSLLTWASQAWRVNAIHYLEEGYALQAFIGKA